MLPKQYVLPLRTIGKPVPPKLSWKLQVVLTWRQRQVVLHPKGSNIWKNDSFWTNRNLVVLKGLNVRFAMVNNFNDTEENIFINQYYF